MNSSLVRLFRWVLGWVLLLLLWGLLAPVVSSVLSTYSNPFGPASLITASVFYAIIIAAGFIVATKGLGTLPAKLITDAPKPRPKVFVMVFVVWMLGMAAAGIVLPGDIRPNADAKEFFLFLVPVLVFTALQCAAEEMVYRVYIARAVFPELPKSPLKILALSLVSGLIFVLPHLNNTEVAETGSAPSVLAFYFLCGAVLMAASCISGGFEAALAIHAANNLYSNLFVEPSLTSWPMAALYKSTRPIDGPLWITAAEIAIPAVLLFLSFALMKKRKA